MGNAPLDRSRIDTLRQSFEAQGQGHVFAFWDDLDATGRESLFEQASAIDLPGLLRGLEDVMARRAEAPPDLEPVEVERAPELAPDGERVAALRERGDALLRAGRVGVLVVAGGQGTRLGYPGPKGGFPIGPVSQRTLFELQAQKIRGLRRRSEQPVPWYVMTSEATDAATRELFDGADFYGLPREDVVFFRQGMVPSFDFEGRLMLERSDRIFANPDGHGGSLTALLRSGTLDDMERRGVDTLFYYQVDNPLVRIADPYYLGCHAASSAEMSCKVIRKTDPREKVGVVARSGGRTLIVEYTELDDAHAEARDDAGDLVYWTGSTAIHVFSTAFIRRVAADAERLLPYHASAKKIPCVDADGNAVKPEEPNGYKLERFVFDAIPAAKTVCVVEAVREQEYSPVKNADGGDSPATARRDLAAQARSWLADAGIQIPPEGTPIEVDHSRIDSSDDARVLGIRAAAEAGDLVTIDSGGPS